jgi:23S rRNA (uracil1939-C5)-methyltransferase
MSYKVNRLDDFGRGITLVNNKVCFINNALIDEEVEIEIVNEKNKYYEANCKKIIKKSKKRVKTECPYYSLCGGCNTSHMSYEDELEFKKKKVEKIIKKYAKIDNVVKEIIPTNRNGYRNKITLKIKDGKLGYFQSKSYDLVNIDNCLLCNKKINKVISILNKINLQGVNEIVIRCNKKDEVLVYLIGLIEDEDYYIKNLKDIDNIVISDYKNVKTIKGNNYLIDEIGNLSFRVSYNSFFQVNTYGVETLYNKIKEYANLTGKENILDLYCGTGSIGMYLASNANSVFGIEINQNAINDANYNIELNNVNNIEFLCEDISKIKNNYKNIDLVILDPPRSGLSLEAISNILSIRPKKIIYVSCEPITLARDINIIKEKYNIKEITIVDMFPNTYHCESVCVLERKNS